MLEERESIPPSVGPSNTPPDRSAASLAEALRSVIEADDPDEAARRALVHAIQATGCDRGFLVCAGRSAGRLDPLVVGAASRRAGVEEPPSRTVLAWALAGRRRLVCPDVSRDGRLASGASVRALRLRSVTAAPLPGPAGRRAALVLESLGDSAAFTGDGVRAVDDLAALAAVAFVRREEPAGYRPAGTGAARGDRAPDLVGSSPSFLALLERIDVLARTSLPVILVGETGTGKEALAHRLHARSARAPGPLVAVNCAALPESLIEAELFGVARGAFTGADRDRPGLVTLAHGGTLFLDEIGDMAPPAQAKLLRVLQDGVVRPLGAAAETRVDLRVVAATHRDLETMAAEGRFRADLYWRIAAATLHVPPLRERPLDLPALATHLIDRLSRRHGLPAAPLAPSALEKLGRRAWPGNVRELEAVLARAMIAAGGATIAASHLAPEPVPGATGDTGPRTRESAMIEGTLAECGGNLTRAASRIGWSRQKLYRRIAALGLERRP